MLPKQHPQPEKAAPVHERAPARAALLHPDLPDPCGADLNRAIFEQLIGEIGEEATGEILDVFLSDTADRLNTLRQLSLQDNRPSIRTEAHSLKSAAASLGMERLSKAARILENEALTIAEPQYHASLDRLEAAFGRARAHVKPSVYATFTD